MPVQNSVFGSKDFWELYLFLESSALSDEEVEKQLELLKNDFPVREDLIEFEYQ
ncbi:MAG: hypothetical protein JSS81_24610 [Acidobacteria bacterium]|nr:hypothetical protein [Acidobacteriota bacterium]